jgi:hypothetical protein
MRQSKSDLIDALLVRFRAVTPPLTREQTQSLVGALCRLRVTDLALLVDLMDGLTRRLEASRGPRT